MIFELHCHSSHSDGFASPKEIIDLASTKLDGIAITDHNTIGGSIEAKKYEVGGFEVITGLEVSAKEGHILALGVVGDIYQDQLAKDVIEQIHSQGGIAIAAHPYDIFRSGVGDLILNLDFDAVEVINGHTITTSKDPVNLCVEAGISQVGGSDAHMLSEVGSVTVEFEGDWKKAICSGNVRIHSKPKSTLALNRILFTARHKLKRFI